MAWGVSADRAGHKQRADALVQLQERHGAQDGLELLKTAAQQVVQFSLALLWDPRYV